jgi:hypothetical protein
MRIATGEIEEGAGAPLDDGKDPLRSLGRKGGEARAAGMTAKRRKEIAKKAAAKRWGNDGRLEGLAPQLRNSEVYFTRYCVQRAFVAAGPGILPALSAFVTSCTAKPIRFRIQ